jgi:thioredoxin reductase (NADPH)
MSSITSNHLLRTKVLIIGSGPAGYTAAIYAARANLKPIQVLGIQPGGQLMITTDVENFPGFSSVVQGPWLMSEMQQQAEHVGTAMLHGMIESLDLNVTPFQARTDDKRLIVADTVIIATGAQAKWLGHPSEELFRGFGVSACATCDGFFFKDQDIAIVGGGNSAVEEALYLTNHARHVTLIHRRDRLRAEQIAQDRLFKHPKISVVWNTVIDDVCGTENPRSLTHLKLRNVQTDVVSSLDVTGLFVAIGHSPSSSLVKGQLQVDTEGYIVTHPNSTHTSIPGVFAAGDVQDKIFRQAVTAAGQGCMAALEAERYISHHLIKVP